MWDLFSLVVGILRLDYARRLNKERERGSWIAVRWQQPPVLSRCAAKREGDLGARAFLILFVHVIDGCQQYVGGTAQYQAG